MSGIPSWARVGAKVVCVDNAFHGGLLPVLQVGAVYEIFRVVPLSGLHRGPYARDRVGCALVGIHNPYMRDGSFALSRFRPLVTRTQEQDVALFTHLLQGKPVEDRV